MGAEGLRPGLDELNIDGRMEADRQFITNPADQNFGKIRDTKEMENAAAQVNANKDAGRPDEFSIVGEGVSPYAEQIGRKVAGPEAYAQEVRAAAHGAELTKRNIEDHQRPMNEAQQKNQQE